MKKILLIGNPNVGKSVIFSHLTGVDVISSNYPGTTVEFVKGYLKFESETYEVIDLPGIYSLEPTTKAEEVAVKILEETLYSKELYIVVNILDATNLERNLNLTLQLIKKRLPIILVLNFCDEIKHKGISIDYNKLQKILDIPIVSSCARSGEGIKDLITKLKQPKISNFDFDLEKKWDKIGEIITQVQKITHRHHTLLDRISEISIHPLGGLIIAFLVLVLSFLSTRFIAESLIGYILDPLFNKLYLSFLESIFLSFPKIIRDIFLGKNPQPMESFGILTTGVYIPIVVVLPYILSFYFILSILEDIGYLPRLAIMLDNFLHKLGVHGYTSISVLLGFGCKVPGILATRILETKREKIIASVLVLMIAPCMPQTAMIVSLVSPYGIKYVVLVFFIIFLNAILISFLLNNFLIKGEIPELFLEIPPYRMLHFPTLAKKVYIRIKEFFLDAVPLIFLGIVIINIFELFSIDKLIISSFGKIFMPILGLPYEVSSVVILGFLRKDVSIALLRPFNLSINQLIVASVFMVLYLPCVSTFFILLKEHGIKTTLKIILLMFFGGLLLGFIIRNIISFQLLT
ncbi:MAG: FeoB small GTPase domain-containing protein [Endomicrobiia bacterium]